MKIREVVRNVMFIDWYIEDGSESWGPFDFEVQAKRFLKLRTEEIKNRATTKHSEPVPSLPANAAL